MFWKILFVYNKSTCFCKEFPELDVKEDSSKDGPNEKDAIVSVAPGEEKYTQIFYMKMIWMLNPSHGCIQMQQMEFMKNGKYV